MQPTLLPALGDVPSSALTTRLYEIRREERSLLVEFLAYLAELDKRQLYLELGFSSCFAFLCEHLGYTRSAAFRRTTAARLLARFPTVAPYLADGRLGLTTLVELRDVLDQERLGEILDRAAGKTEDQVKELVAALRPRPAPMDLLRRLPAPRSAPAPPAPAAPVDRFGPALPTAPPPPRVEPISDELRVLRMTVGRDFVADLESVRAALSHQIPDGNLEKVIHECVRRTLREHAHRQVGSGPRYIPAAVRDEVWRRDEGRCAFVGTDGHRCGSTHKVQFHHIRPFAKGGASTAENLTIVCAGHNGLRAEKDYGPDHMSRYNRRNGLTATRAG